MSEMVERVARALAMSDAGKMIGQSQNAASQEFGWKGDGKHFEMYVEAYWKKRVHAAQFAIEAMREPTLEQRSFLEGKVGTAWIEGWHAMVDAAWKQP